LRTVYSGHYGKISDQLEPLLKESREVQKLFLAMAIKKMRDALLVHLGMEHLALMTKAEREFQSNFAKTVNPGKIEHITRLLEESSRQLTGNANPQMVFSALSLKVHQIMRS
jgi:hypothetical protein